MKKIAPIIVVLALVIVGFITYRVYSTQEAPVEEVEKKKTVEQVNILPLSERPYLYITPESDGKNITITVESLKKSADSMEFELEYQSGSLLQGVFGNLELSSFPARTTQLLGSCSAGGACTYHEDVSGGTILTRYSGSEGYVLKSDWKYFENSNEDTEFSSRDAKFQLSSEDLANANYLIITNAPGYPEGLSGTAVSDPYALQASSSLKGKGTLTMRAQESGNLRIMGWDGKTWKMYEGSIDDKMITAEVDLLPLYIVVTQ